MKTESIKLSEEEINRNHEIFEQRNSVYIQHGFDQQKARQNLINRIESSNKSFLEVGTGKGRLTLLLARNFAGRIVSIDPNQEAQHIAKLNAAYYNVLDRIEFINEDICHCNFPDQSFDAIISEFTFHHLDAPFKVIREMIRVAKHQVVISDFSDNGFDIIDRIHADEGKTHERGTNDFSIVGAFLKEFNFKVSRFEDEWQVIYSALRK